MGSILSMRGIGKWYPGVHALNGVDFDLEPGEVHALVGENGAGKSTLIKILSGATPNDEGTIELDGKRIDPLTPVKSQAAGICVVYQEINLVPQMSVLQNIYLGTELDKGLFCDDSAMRVGVENLLSRLGVQISPNKRVSELSTAQQQMVEIAKGLLQKARILVLDEPTAALTSEEIEKLFEVIRTLKSQGVSIVYISHRLEEIYMIADRITVLRDGNYICTSTTDKLTNDQLIKYIVGRELSQQYPNIATTIGNEMLRVDHLTNGKIQDVSFAVKAGEILGFAGLVGSGRTEILRAIFGADSFDSGKIYVKGKEVTITDPKSAIANGIALVPEERKSQGLILSLSCKANITMAYLKKICRFGFVRERAENEIVDEQVKSIQIKCANTEYKASTLSGGNQQKLVIAKWLCCNSDILLVDEPTRGIDVGAKNEIYELMKKACNDGRAIVMVSSDLPELLGVADRIIVMHEGKISGELKKEEFDSERILRLATNT